MRHVNERKTKIRMMFKRDNIQIIIFFSFLIINRQMNPDEKSKYTNNEPNLSDLTFKRYDSFINKMSLIGNKIF